MILKNLFSVKAVSLKIYFEIAGLFQVPPLPLVLSAVFLTSLIDAELLAAR